jgi:hypothetical protein
MSKILEEQYFDEKGKRAIVNGFNDHDEYSIGYVFWLEKKLTEATQAAEERPCPYWYNYPDNFSYMIKVDRCNHPDCEKWRKANEQNSDA